ncbi:J domain-containing protein [Pleurocapsales cyanobacterium LEGE 10410]|nr:J domain-containing protein [Pleurocapsales cyanobacterium LEGE 10410]
MPSAEFKDYYAILRVKRTANTDEIKKKFRQLALKYHPDRNQGNKVAEAKFKEISEAYDVLSDIDKRAKYDKFGQYWQQSSTSYSSYSSNTTNTEPQVDANDTDFSQYANFDEFINELLGRFSSPNSSTNSPNYSSQTSSSNGNASYRSNFQDLGVGTRSPMDTKANISLSYAEAFRGTTKRINWGTETLTVRIPAGAKPGSRIRIAGKGKPSLNSSQQDLYLNVKLDSHSFFNFEGDNLVCEVPIAPDEAVLGSSIPVPTPDATVTMKVPAGIQSGQVLRLRGKGWSSPQGNRTDLLVKIIVAIPQQINPLEREYYQKVRDVRTKNPRDYLKGISL